MEVLFLLSNFRLYPGLNMSFEQIIEIIVRKNHFLSACFCCDSTPFLREMNQNYKFGGTNGYGNSYLELLIRLFKIFRLHAKLYDAAGAVRAHCGKSPGYCYIIGRGTNSFLFGHVTGLLFCLYVKIFLPPFSILLIFETVRLAL